LRNHCKKTSDQNKSVQSGYNKLIALKRFWPWEKEAASGLLKTGIPGVVLEVFGGGDVEAKFSNE
jgi:hypothetical protein